eukprot:736491-Pleurochrysis_carterae.AAC.1
MEDVSKSLSGRDCKLFAEKAGDIFPDLLEFVLAPQEAIEAAAKEAMAEARSTGSSRQAVGAGDAGDGIFTMRRTVCESDESEDADDDDDDGTHEDGWARRLRYAKYFDDFFTC